MQIDLHSHILPEMDDGARDTAESLKLLEMLSASGVEKAVLTPHFYRQDENIGEFLRRREISFGKLSEAMKGNNSYPELITGAEVLFYPSLASDPDLGRLCIGNTDYILLELPFKKFHDDFFVDFARFVNKCGLQVILAHIERYMDFGNTEDDIMRLSEYGVLCQMNCSAAARASFSRKRKLMKLISGGHISALGTDAHDLSRRPPMYSEAKKAVISSCGSEAFEMICSRSEMILGGSSVNAVKMNILKK